MIQNVSGADAQLKLTAGLTKAERAVQRRIQSHLEQPGDRVAPRIAKLARRRYGKCGGVEVAIRSAIDRKAGRLRADVARRGKSARICQVTRNVSGERSARHSRRISAQGPACERSGFPAAVAHHAVDAHRR